MELSAPRNLQDVLSDGLFLTAAQDLAFSASFGQISSVEFNFHAAETSPPPLANNTAQTDTPAAGAPTTEGTGEPATTSTAATSTTSNAASTPQPVSATTPETAVNVSGEPLPAPDGAGFPASPAETTPAQYVADVSVDVRITCSTGVHDFEGTRIAVIEDNLWTWATASAARLSVTELQGSHPYTDAMVQAARTINAGRPVFIAQQGEHLCAVVINLYSASLPWQEVLARGLEQSKPETDEKRALTALAVAMNFEDMPAVSFNGKRITSFPGRRGSATTTLAHVVTDAFYATVEHKLFYTGRFPDCRLQIDWQASRGNLLTARGYLPVQANVVATVTNGVFTWAWADPRLASNPMSAAARNLKEFGIDCGIPELIRPYAPAQQAYEQHFLHAAMRILNVWTLETAQLDDYTQALVLVSAPELALPPLSPAVRAAVLRVPLPKLVDRKAALYAYEQLRGIPHS